MHDPASETTVGTLLDRAARAFPAAAEENRHGWWLRHTDTATWWAGAVLAHGPDENRDTDSAIAAAERFYAGHRTAACFQICADCPPWLDPALAQRGYRLECPTSLRVCAASHLAGLDAPSPLQARVSDRPNDAWLATSRGATASGAQPTSERRLLERVRNPSGYVTIFDSARPIAVGRCVADRGWTGVFGMATVPDARRRGAAGLVLSAIGRWAANQQAPRIYLQVERDNVAALRLYETAGFVELASYHYRVSKTSGHSADGRAFAEM